MKSVFMVATAALFTTAASAQTVLGPPQFSTNYSNRGQCESALAKERNAQRKDATTRGAGYQDLSGSEFNRASRDTTRCEMNAAGTGYNVVFDPDGFDDSDDM